MRVLSSRLLEVSPNVYRHWCPACDTYHDIHTEPWGRRITFCTYDGNPDKPTFSPSVRIRHDDLLVCHYFLSEGIIHFCEDAHHEYAGTEVELPKLPVSVFRIIETQAK